MPGFQRTLDRAASKSGPPPGFWPDVFVVVERGWEGAPNADVGWTGAPNADVAVGCDGAPKADVAGCDGTPNAEVGAGCDGAPKADTG